MEPSALGPVILPKRRGWWLTGAGLVICLAVVYGLWFLPVLTSWPTGVFDQTVARQLEREAKIQAPITQHADARQDVTTIAQALHFFESNKSDSGQMYSVTTSDALQGAAAVAITTVAIPPVLLNSMNHGRGPAVPSVCHAFHAASAETSCNSLTVLWVRPRKELPFAPTSPW